MNKILILKNDRVGDLFHAIKGINSILNEHKYHEIEIVLSNFSKDLKFLFNINNTKTSILNYNLNLFEKLSIIKKIIFTKYEKIFILSPKNIYFYLPLISKSKFYAISVKDLKRDRPFNFLKKRLHKFKINDRTNKKIFESIENLIEEISNESLTNYPNLLNNDPSISNILKKNLHLFDNFIHIHYKHSLFKKNGWSIKSFIDLSKKISIKTDKVFITSDYGNNNYNDEFLNSLSYINFDSGLSNIFNNSKIIYLHNIKIYDLFKVISLSDQVVSPHGTMSVMASYLKKKVIDLFDITISINSFREFKPSNNEYNFLILKSASDKVKNKIINFL